MNIIVQGKKGYAFDTAVEHVMSSLAELFPERFVGSPRPMAIEEAAKQPDRGEQWIDIITVPTA